MKCEIFLLAGLGVSLFETLCASNHTACRFAEKTLFFHFFGSGGTVPSLAFCLFKGKTL